MEVDEDLILPEEPPQDPNRPLSADEQIFATHHSHSEFDIATLVRDCTRALQFFRWHEHIQQQYSKLVAHSNDTLTAMTNKVGQIFLDIHPIYPFNASELPADSDTLRQYNRSKSFTLKIQNVVAEGSERGICTVYRCQITSIDDNPVLSPSLCLKLFDDRFQPLQSPDENAEEPDEFLPRWFDSLVIAEMYALDEAAAYDKLHPAQGSVIPWFYGTHQFTLPDGTVLYGLLMGYIEGCELDSDFARELSPAHILDVAGVSQRDWHNGQILYTNPTTTIDHVVLIDFASTTQTWEPHELNFIDNYFGTLHVLLGRRGDVGFDPELVWKHYGEPDDLDSVEAWIPTSPGNTEMRVVKTRYMFPYISFV
ncbi:hypothetical protein M422DRAFT_44280 [Sphaerobolus stellatus SS14]|nr:hypothetical protein M422DRAFT_44280 [Sphaerobolus stellatus SS14]